MEKLWERLSRISKLEFTSVCRKLPPTFEQRKGEGKVDVKDPTSETITFFERGKWASVRSDQQMGFTNIIRWGRDRKENSLTLEHLRLGADRPVHLFTLVQVEENLFKSLKPHECKEDAYFGSVLFDDHYIHLNWRIVGPVKNELMSVVYFFS